MMEFYFYLILNVNLGGFMKKLLLMMLGVLAFGACTNERGRVLSITDNVLERYKGLKVYVVDTTLTTMDLIRKAALDCFKSNATFFGILYCKLQYFFIKSPLLYDMGMERLK